MAAPVFGFPEFTQASPLYAPSLSGGSWVTSLPITNVVDRRLDRVARTTDAAAASSTIVFDLGVARAVGVLAVLCPNLTKSSTPTIEWKANSSSSFVSPAYDSGAVQAWPTGLTAEDVTGADGTEQHVWSFVLPASAQTYRFWQLVVTDTANADGYIDVARVMICAAYQPSITMSVGAKSALETDSVRLVTPGGAALYTQRPVRRSDTFTIDNLPQSETLATIRKLHRRNGISKQMPWIFDPTDDALTMAERSYVGVLRQLDALSYPDVLPAMTVPFQVLEDL